MRRLLALMTLIMTTKDSGLVMHPRARKLGACLLKLPQKMDKYYALMKILLEVNAGETTSTAKIIVVSISIHYCTNLPDTQVVVSLLAIL